MRQQIAQLLPRRKRQNIRGFFSALAGTERNKFGLGLFRLRRQLALLNISPHFRQHLLGPIGVRGLVHLQLQLLALLRRRRRRIGLHLGCSQLCSLSLQLLRPRSFLS